MDNLPTFPNINSFGPLKFLEPYTEQDEPVFPKRDNHALTLINCINSYPLVVVSGETGCGKTSLLNAQIIPILKSSGKVPICIHPGGDLQDALRAALYGIPVRKLQDEHRHRPILQVVADKISQQEGSLVLILDHFEQVIDFYDDKVTRNFLEILNSILFPLAEPRKPLAHIVISVDESFLPDTRNLLAQILGEQANSLFYYALPHLSDDELIQFFKSIDQSGKLEIPDQLVQKLIDDFKKYKLKTIDIQSILSRLVEFTRENQNTSNESHVSLSITTLNNLGGSANIVCSLLDAELERILNWFSTQSDQASQTHNLALYKRGFHVILKSLISERLNPVPASLRGIIHRVIADNSGINRHLAQRLVAALRLSGLLRKQVNENFYICLPHGSLCDRINTWVTFDSSEKKLIKLRDQIRRILSKNPAPDKLASDLKGIKLTSEFLKLGFSKPELRLFFQSSILSVNQPNYWYHQLTQEADDPAPLIRQIITNSDYQQRVKLIRSLFYIGSQMVSFIIALLDDTYPKVRANAIAALEQLETSGAWRSSLSKESYIVPGEFILGNERSVFQDEKPSHVVPLGGFYISRHPVTYQDYKMYMSDISEYFEIPTGMNRYPMVDVTWFEARQYAQWSEARLPTEAEWEKAASWHPGTDSPIANKWLFPWGDVFDENKCNMRASKLNSTTRVGKYTSRGGDSYYHCADMVGNVWEWTSTTYREYPYNPDDGREDPTADESRVIRGGSYENGDSYVTCTVRAAFDPYSMRNDLGFRIVLVIPDTNAWNT